MPPLTPQDRLALTQAKAHEAIEASIAGLTGSTLHSARYRRSLRGIIRHMYLNMRRRVNNPVLKTYHKLPLCTWPEFEEVATKSEQLHQLYLAWVASGFKQPCSPSVDRIENAKGYVVDNIQFLPNAHNTSKYMRNDFQGRGTGSQFIGVSVHSQSGQWLADIKRWQTHCRLGAFPTEREAAAAHTGAAMFYEKLEPMIVKLESEITKLRDVLEQARYQMDFAPTKKEGAKKAYQLINSAL